MILKIFIIMAITIPLVIMWAFLLESAKRVVTYLKEMIWVAKDMRVTMLKTTILDESDNYGVAKINCSKIESLNNLIDKLNSVLFSYGQVFKMSLFFWIPVYEFIDHPLAEEIYNLTKERKAKDDE